MEHQQKEVINLGKRISAYEFWLGTGYLPDDDDLERSNCKKAGLFQHKQCGWCYGCSLPVFMGCECDYPLWKEITRKDEEYTVYNCNNCNAHAETPQLIKHHDTCNPGSALYARWAGYHNEEDPDEFYPSEPDSEINNLCAEN